MWVSHCGFSAWPADISQLIAKYDKIKIGQRSADWWIYLGSCWCDYTHGGNDHVFFWTDKNKRRKISTTISAPVVLLRTFCSPWLDVILHSGKVMMLMMRMVMGMIMMRVVIHNNKNIWALETCDYRIKCCPYLSQWMASLNNIHLPFSTLATMKANTLLSMIWALRCNHSL